MLKWLLLAAVLGVFLWWWARGRGGAKRTGLNSGEKTRPTDAGPTRGSTTARASRPPETMLACAHCGTLVPAGEVLAGPAPQAHPYCSEEHRRAGPASPGGPAP